MLFALVSMAMFVALMITTTSIAQETKPALKPGRVTVKATIEAIDPATRTLTLKGPKGNLVKVKATDEVKRFDQLKVGDVITASYSESVIVRFRKPGDPAPAAEQVAVVRRADKPGGAAVIEEILTVTIVEIDRAKSLVTVKGPGGNLYTHRARDTALLSNLKVGDKVDIVYRLGVLLKVDTPAK